MEQSIARHFIFINNPAFLFSVITQTLGFTLNTVGGTFAGGILPPWVEKGAG